MNYPDSVQFLYALGNEIKSAKLGLERIRAVLEALGNPERAYRVVHVAGTNGKGSTCAMIEAGLRAAGVRTGLFTSPHLIEPTERIQIDGIPVEPAADFERAFNVVHETADKLDLDCHPTLLRNRHGHGLLAVSRKARPHRCDRSRPGRTPGRDQRRRSPSSP